jgi:hypothetical protein
MVSSETEFAQKLEVYAVELGIGIALRLLVAKTDISLFSES